MAVMFNDLVGSTSMAAKLDAEFWRALVNTYLDEASAVTDSRRPCVPEKARRRADGAAFGYPHAQENDAERAVQAALAIQRWQLVEINAKKRQQRRAGAFRADRPRFRAGRATRREKCSATRLFAARGPGAAEPGSILITATVPRVRRDLFVAEDRGQHELKGMSTPITLYRVVRASGGGRRGGARSNPLRGGARRNSIFSPGAGGLHTKARASSRWSSASLAWASRG